MSLKHLFMCCISPNFSEEEGKEGRKGKETAPNTTIKLSKKKRWRGTKVSPEISELSCNDESADFHRLNENEENDKFMRYLDGVLNDARKELVS